MNVHADLRGAVVSGQVAVGDNIVQIHAEAGAVVNYAAAAQQEQPELRPLPVRLLPRDFPRPLGRDDEIREANAALGECTPVELHGPEGVGKTSLLRHLSHRPPESASEGVVYQLCRAQPVEDVLQFAFESLYECAPPRVAAPAELRRHLQQRKALLVVDDAELGRDDICALLDAAPSCWVLLAGREPSLAGEGKCIPLGPLDDEAAAAVIERELGRELTPDERTRALAAMRADGGTPLDAVEAAAAVRTGALGGSVVEALPGADRAALEPLAALPDVPLRPADVRELTGVAGADGALEALERHGLAQREGDRFRATGTAVAAMIPTDAARGKWVQRTLSRVAAAEAPAPDDDRRERRSYAIAVLELLAYARRAGYDREAFELARAADTTLALGGQWGAWRVSAGAALEAARVLGDRAGEAWALHQLGSRGICLGETGAAAQLEEAARMREALGDVAGAELSRQNLERAEPGPPGEPGRVPRNALIAAVAAAILAVLLVLLLTLGFDDDDSARPVRDTGATVPGSTVPEEPATDPPDRTDAPERTGTEDPGPGGPGGDPNPGDPGAGGPAPDPGGPQKKEIDPGKPDPERRDPAPPPGPVPPDPVPTPDPVPPPLPDPPVPPARDSDPPVPPTPNPPDPNPSGPHPPTPHPPNPDPDPPHPCNSARQTPLDFDCVWGEGCVPAPAPRDRPAPSADRDRGPRSDSRRRRHSREERRPRRHAAAPARIESRQPVQSARGSAAPSRSYGGSSPTPIGGGSPEARSEPAPTLPPPPSLPDPDL